MNLLKRRMNKGTGKKFFTGRTALLAAGMLAAGILAAGTLSGCQSGGGRTDAATGEPGGGEETREDVKNVAKGRFMEMEIALPDEVKDISLISSLQNEDGSFDFYFFDKESGYYRYIFDGTDWKKNENLPALPAEITMRNVFDGNDGKRYVLGYDHDYVFHLYEIPEDGAAVERFPGIFEVPEGEEYGPIPDYVNTLKNGNLLVSEISEAGVYAPDGEKVLSFPQEFIGMDQRMAAFAGEDHYLTIADGKSRLARYDTETGEETGSFDIPEKSSENMMNTVLFEDEDGGIYAAGPSGLFHTGKDGTIWEQVIDGTLNSMNRQDLYVEKFYKDSEAGYYGVYKKTGGRGTVFLHYIFDKSVDTVPPETVSVYALRDNTTVRQAAALLQKNNPQIRVDFRIAVEDENEEVSEDVIRALNTELLNGKGADVLILDGLPVDSYLEKGILADMTELFGGMKTELLPQVTDGFTGEDGRVFCLPARIKLPVVFGAPEAVEARKSLDKMKEYAGEPTLFSMDIYENLLRQTAVTCYQEIFEKDGRVGEENLKRYLEAVKAAGERAGVMTEFTEPETKRYNVNNSVLPDGFGRQSSFTLVQKKCAAAVQILDSIDSAMLPFAAAGQEGCELQAVNGIYLPDTLVGVNASAVNGEGAKEFIRTLFSKEVQDESLWNGFPVRNDSLERWKEMEKDSIVSIGSASSDDSLSGNWPSREERDWLINLVKNTARPVIVNQSVMQLIVDGSKNYLDGKETVEGAVSAIENKIRLYMAEKE